MAADVIPGWSICCIPFRLSCLLDPPAPGQQHRRRNGRAYPHFPTTQQLYNPWV